MVNYRSIRASLILVLGLMSMAAAQTSVRLSATPAANIVTAGNSVTYTINLTRANYTDKVTLTAANLPAGAAASFNPNATTGATSTLKITTTTATPAGAYTVKVTGAAAGLTIDPLNLSLQVKAPPSVSLTTDAEVQCVMAGQSATYAVDIQRNNFDGPLTFTAADVPAGMTAFFEPATTYGNRIYFRLQTPANAGSTFGTLTINTQGLGVAASRNLRIYTNCGLVWTAQTGSNLTENPATPSFEVQSKITTDNIGNAYLVGSTTGGLEGTSGFNAGSTDVFLVKYDAFGNRLWTQQFGGPGEDRASEVKTDSAGNIFVAGYTNGAIDSTTTAFGNFDVWLAKFNANGVRLSVQQFGDQFEQGPYGIELIPDNNGAATVMYLSGDRGRVRLTVEKRGPQGSAAFTVTSGSFFPIINELTVAPDGSVYLAGHVAVSGQGGGNGGRNAPYTAKYTTGGTRLWEQIYGGVNFEERANRIAADNAGNVYLAGCRLPGTSRNDATDASCSDTNTALNVNEDAWVKKLNSTNGSELWERSFTTPARDVIGGIEAKDYTETVGNQQVTKHGVYLAGFTEGTLADRPAGGADMWLARYKDDGNEAILRQFGSAGRDRGLTLAVDNNGYVLLSGTSDSNFGGSHLGDDDVWVLKYAPGTNPSYLGSFTPASGPAGTQVTINGNFGIIVTEVRFGGVLAQFTRLSSTQLRATVPAGAVSGRIAVSQLVLAGQCPTAVSATNFSVQ